jgi:uracil-DNA glycosylase family protein
MPTDRSLPQSTRRGPIDTTEISSIDALSTYAADCISCPLYRNATQTVFGVGPNDAEMMIIGEQPGEREDREGVPFFGPAGQLLDRAFERASIDRDDVYLTNAVKHFKWRASGTKRIHETPSVREVDACYPWLAAEIRLIQPLIVVCLGATATRAVLRRRVTLKELGAKPAIGPHGGRTFSTLHPSAILRMREQHERENALESLVKTLVTAKAWTLQVKPVSKDRGDSHVGCDTPL